ncbi:MAG: molybdenum cofactor biosynthesis protein MoaE [Bacteroidota bacterium]
MTKSSKNIFIEGAISPDFIAQAITELQAETAIGAHDIFLGQVRADIIEGKMVAAITYEAYEGMADAKFAEITEAAFARFDLTNLAIYHSVGKVAVGELCLFVMASAPHRQVVFEALRYVVEAIKKEVPVFGKELFEDNTHQWKVNT